MRYKVMGNEKRSGNLKRQLVSYHLLLIMLPTLLFHIFVLYSSRTLILREAERYSMQSVTQYTQKLDQYMEDMVRISLLPMYDSDVQSVLRGDNRYYIDEKYVELFYQDKLQNFIFTMANLRSEITGVFIYCEDGRVYHSGNYRGSLAQNCYNSNFDYTQSEWYEKAKKAEGKSVIIPTHVQTQLVHSTTAVFSVAKIIRDVRTGEDIALIVIDIGLSQLEEFSQGVLEHPGGVVMIATDGGVPVYSTAEEDMELFLKTIFRNELHKGIQYLTFEGEKYLVNTGLQEYSGWYVFQCTPIRELLSYYQNYLYMFTLLMISLAAVEILLICKIANRVTGPIYRMVECITDIEQGNLQVEVDVPENNEIGILADSFNAMQERLRDFLYSGYYLQMECRQAKLFALQSQIHPHFLYNTLDSIHMMAEINCDYEVAEMVTGLSKIMRYTISNPQEVVTIAEEIQYLNSYMELQKLHYEDRLNFTVYMEKELDAFIIPRLIFQPLVENSIYHGLGMCGKKIEITLSGAVRNGQAVFDIQDNGRGMTEDQLQEIQSWAHEKNSRFDKVGIRNVLWRLRYRYGTDAVVLFESKVGMGVKVTIKLPMKKQD